MSKANRETCCIKGKITHLPNKSLTLVILVWLTLAAPLLAQQTPEPQQPTPPPGTVILHRSTDQPDQPSTQESSSSSSNPNSGPHPTELILPTDAERSSLTFTGLDLNIHLTPATSHLEANTIFTIKNTGTAPLTHIALQLSSTLHWQAISLRSQNRLQPLAYAQHIIDTAADHTGQAAEAVINLPEPLAPGSTLDLTAFYAGEIATSTQRLEHIGAAPNDAAYADWDAITPAFTGLRGFGNVLWYPTAAAPISLTNTGQLSPLGLLRLRQSTATIRLRLSIDYTGEAPAAAYFCGRREILTPAPTDPAVPVTESSGIATAEFPAQPLGFRSPSLFVVSRNTVATDNMLIAAVTSNPEVLPSYNAGSQLVRPLLSDWLSPNPLEPLTLIDHEGQPFEDGALVVVPMHANDAGALAPALAHSLTHAWFRSTLPWLNEGIPQFLSLLWIEQNKGRDVALSLLRSQVNTLALAEPQLKDSEPATGQPLIEAHDEAFYGTKSASVLWMLRTLAGDAALKRTLTSYRDTVANNPKQESPQLFQHLLEQNCHKDLAWFFNDWVYRDRGLADLSIASVTPRDLSTAGKTTWLVAVEVRNDGYAVAEVPVTVRSGNLTKTEYVHLPGRTTASTRIIFEGIPAEVIVNDGTIPEPTAPTHVQRVALPDQTR
jgi:hypothetical protein